MFEILLMILAHSSCCTWKSQFSNLNNNWPDKIFILGCKNKESLSVFVFFCFFFWKEISETIFSIEWFLYECLVISLLFEADKITKSDTQNESVADVVAINQSNERKNVVDILQMHLNDYNLEMEETAGDGDCFLEQCHAWFTHQINFIWMCDLRQLSTLEITGKSFRVLLQMIILQLITISL